MQLQWITVICEVFQDTSICGTVQIQHVMLFHLSRQSRNLHSSHYFTAVVYCWYYPNAWEFQTLTCFFFFLGAAQKQEEEMVLVKGPFSIKQKTQDNRGRHMGKHKETVRQRWSAWMTVWCLHTSSLALVTLFHNKCRGKKKKKEFYRRGKENNGLISWLQLQSSQLINKSYSHTAVQIWGNYLWHPNFTFFSKIFVMFEPLRFSSRAQMFPNRNVFFPIPGVFFILKLMSSWL